LLECIEHLRLNLFYNVNINLSTSLLEKA